MLPQRDKYKSTGPWGASVGFSRSVAALVKDQPFTAHYALLQNPTEALNPQLSR